MRAARGSHSPERSAAILGTRGIPACHGGFETFAERLALHLAGRGWRVTVYCQGEPGTTQSVDTWNGIERVHIPAPGGTRGTVVFDLLSTWHAVRHRRGVALTLGYNTAVFALLYRLAGLTNVFNMDGIEWQRSKWSWPCRAWFYVNERLGCWLGHQLIADHPSIAEHLGTRVRGTKIVMIPYGADAIQEASAAALAKYELSADGYALLVARPEPENSVAEIVAAWSSKPRGRPLVVLGRYDPETNAYHRRVLDAAGPEVRFPGAVYERSEIAALRFHCRLYVHGHRVGGTNPSLVEAMGAGNAVLAQDNRFNRWVAGEGARYFAGATDCALAFDSLLDDDAALAHLRSRSRARHGEAFAWDHVLEAYERLLWNWQAPDTAAAMMDSDDPSEMTPQ